VISYDGATKMWTILRTYSDSDEKYRIVVACREHKYANGETLKGRDACSLQVGRLYHMVERCDNGDVEGVYEDQSMQSVSISEGHRTSEDRLSGRINYQDDRQWFDILRLELLPENH
jgi:hypothetical protein